MTDNELHTVQTNAPKQQWEDEGVLWRRAADETGFCIGTSPFAKSTLGTPVRDCIAVFATGPSGVRNFSPSWRALERFRNERKRQS